MSHSVPAWPAPGLIGLFTDFGMHDAYVAQLKGAILSINPQALLHDLNHQVGQFDPREAAYLLDHSSRYFPADTIFVAVVDPGVGSSRRPLLLETQAHKFYIAPDNGLLTRVLERELLMGAYELRQSTYFLRPDVSATFHGRDIFGPVAAHLSLGVAPACFGPPLEDIVMLPRAVPRLEGRTIQGEIVHIDHFGNILTNITPDFLTEISPGHQLSITIRHTTLVVPLRTTYADGSYDRPICLFSSNDEFEIAVSQGRAAAYFAAQVGDSVVLHK